MGGWISNTHFHPIPLPPRHRLPRLLDLLQHRLVREPFVRVHVRGLRREGHFVFVDT